jgi:hypothetical protein
MGKYKKPTNQTRVAQAQKVMDAFCGAGNFVADTDVIDLLTDMMHFCNQKDFDFESLLNTARMHFGEEK